MTDTEKIAQLTKLCSEIYGVMVLAIGTQEENELLHSAFVHIDRKLRKAGIFPTPATMKVEP